MVEPVEAPDQVEGAATVRAGIPLAAGRLVAVLLRGAPVGRAGRRRIWTGRCQPAGRTSAATDFLLREDVSAEAGASNRGHATSGDFSSPPGSGRRRRRHDRDRAAQDRQDSRRRYKTMSKKG